ncbi:protein phosphatase 1 regulatory subunit 27 [Histomonas meleagridis]|uniref:protein phosphatase 1 regulatory subunit 27 n=1 Tax=Histomonas meleagridis TaxID=135588 RepID=UPI003559469F|nr:protein phosphatase 1 regulatory subunit 27 [Histomonas meleagridis]KAH0807015.1 protein phosphatase 1 regulatory subunit 27 [Histomonas meleagridis]
MIAIQEHNTEIVKALLIAGAKVDENPAALHMAVREGVPEIVKQLLLFGANPNAKNRLGKSAFDIIRKPDPDEIEQMLHTVKAEQQCDPSKPRIAIVDQNITSLAELLDTLHVVGNACEEKPKFIVTKM